MVNAVNTGGYQAYSYQQAVTPQAEVRGGDNRIQQRPNPAADSQRGDQRDTASRDDRSQSVRTARANDDSSSSRGQLLDVTA